MAYLHLVTPSLTLGPASGDEGEFVALPLVILAPVAVVDLLMLQEIHRCATNRNLSSPETFLNTGLPLLHLPSSNLYEIAMNNVNLNVVVICDYA